MSKRKQICLITPGHLSTNIRIVKEADALAGAGYHVSVISADYMEWARKADREFANRPWHSVARLRFGPDAPLPLRGLHFVRQRGANQLVRAGMHLPALVRMAWHPIAPTLVRIAQRIPADLYIAHYPAALPAAALAARKHGALFAFDAEDFHLGDPPEGAAYDHVRRLTRLIEGRYLPSCAFVTAASPGIADAYVVAYGISRPVVIRNVFPRVQAPAAPTVRGSAIPGPSLYWFSQTIGADRGLETAVQALGLARSAPHLYLRGNPQPGFVRHLQALAAASGMADRLHILPLASPLLMEQLAAIYDLGYVGETGLTPNRRIALTNKLFTYALAGIPAVISDIPAHRAYAQEAGPAVKLFPVHDPEQLARALDEWLLDEHSTFAAARAYAYNLGQTKLNWECEQTILLRIVEATLQ